MIIDALLSLDAPALSERLRALAGEERNVQVDFLLHLDALDRRRGYAELGYPSLWEYCLRALHLREGAAGRRIGAMRVLRRFPALAASLRDGRLCLSTLCLLGPVLTPDNVEEVTARAAFRTKAETDAIAASVKPRQAPSEGLRRLSPPRSIAPHGPAPRLTPPMAPAVSASMPAPPPLAAPAAPSSSKPPPDDGSTFNASRALLGAGSAPAPNLVAAPPHRPPAPELRAVGEAQWSLRVTLDAEAKRDLETLTHLLAHKVPTGNLGAVLKEALRCAIQKHGVRKGALAPAQRRTAPEPKEAPSRSPSGRPAVPAEVRRQVWARDGGRCSFIAQDGTRCESRWQLELDHVVPWARGGSPTVDNLRLRCRGHNLLHADQVFGRDHMDRFRRREATVSDGA